MISCRLWVGNINRSLGAVDELSGAWASVGVGLGVGLGDADPDGAAEVPPRHGGQGSSSHVGQEDSGEPGAGAGTGLRGRRLLVADRVAVAVAGTGPTRAVALDDGGGVVGVGGASGLADTGSAVGGSTAPAGAAADGGSCGSDCSDGSSVRVAARLIAARNVPTAPLVTSRPTPTIAVRRPGTRSNAPVSASSAGRPGRRAGPGACRPGRRFA
ncbi:hypothetical protein GCM10009682_17100 [Luedemannella flava]|uniref:Uncharacterized protein n=1 Tax=Luedemannella flava TaxID=349316 RepID=A0ABN2LPI7_9ACTN